MSRMGLLRTALQQSSTGSRFSIIKLTVAGDAVGDDIPFFTSGIQLPYEHRQIHLVPAVRPQKRKATEVANGHGELVLLQITGVG